MAKFRNGNLLLTDSQSIEQGSYDRLGASGVAQFASLTLDSDLTTTITSINKVLGSTDTAIPTEGAVQTWVNNKIAGSIGPGSLNELAVYDAANGIQTSLTYISTDGTFTANSDTKIPTEKATKIYVDAKVAGTVATGTDRAIAVYDGTSNIVASAVTISVSGDMTATGDIYANKVWDGVWNDLADFQDLADEYIPGKCYYDTLEGAKICNVRCQKSVIGILSDTFGFALGKDKNKGQAPFAVSGWVLAYVEDDCEPGDPLTNDKHGNLIKIEYPEKCAWPERIVAIYKKPETSDYWGPDGNKIYVNGRHWVKVK